MDVNEASSYQVVICSTLQETRTQKRDEGRISALSPGHQWTFSHEAMLHPWVHSHSGRTELDNIVG
eukprot:2800401-Amphidinium_carterae.1